MTPQPDGTRCDDGQLGTSGDQCVAGLCMGTTVTGLSLSAISPSTVLDARYYWLRLTGTGFVKGSKVSFESASMSKPPMIQWTRLRSSTQLEVLIWARRRSSAETWDVVVTLPDGRQAVLPAALRTDP
jgi:hypothetical protein